jgi:phosphate transport system substrate-binding protein
MMPENGSKKGLVLAGGLRIARCAAVVCFAFVLVSLLPSVPWSAGKKLTINGAGATFPLPVYKKWASRYERMRGIAINYEGIGSGGGIAQIKARTVDFGGTDRPLDAQEQEKEGLIMFPMLMGGVVPVINIQGVRKGQLRLTPELLVDIFMGKIEKWNDRKIRAVNPDLDLPDQRITVVHRADGSGTTWIFTTYLSKVSPLWKEAIGVGKSVSWPTGVGGKGNPGVAALVKRLSGAIGYVEFAYALESQLNYVQLQNRYGDFAKPTIKAFQAAATQADWANAEGFVMDLTDQKGEKTWPIVGVTYIMIHRDLEDKAKAEAMLKFFEWCFKYGKRTATRLHYVPMPEQVVVLVKQLWRSEVTSNGEPVVK